MNLGDSTVIFWDLLYSFVKSFTFMMSNFGTNGSTGLPFLSTNLVYSNSVPRWSYCLILCLFSKTLSIHDYNINNKSYVLLRLVTARLKLALKSRHTWNMLVLIVLSILCLRDSFSKLNSTSYSSLSIWIISKSTFTVPSGIGFCLDGFENSTEYLATNENVSKPCNWIL